MSKSSKKGSSMIKKIVTITIVTLAVIGGINVYNSKTFRNLQNSIIHNETVQAITDIFGDVTHAE